MNLVHFWFGKATGLSSSQKDLKNHFLDERMEEQKEISSREAERKLTLSDREAERKVLVSERNYILDAWETVGEDFCRSLWEGRGAKVALALLFTSCFLLAFL